MARYISELSYAGGTISDFIEIVVPAGTDVSAYSIVKYNTAGKAIATFSLGDIVSTSGFGDVYLVDASTAGFPGLSPNQAVALVDDVGTVLQYSSFDGNVVTATEGPADGLTSAEIGTGGIGESLQSDDDGASYYVPGSPNPGTIPCYAGTMIDTPDGPHGVETLRPGDLVSTLDHGPQPIKWVRDGTEPLNGAPDHSRPVLIQAAALGPGRPLRDLIVSPQHRILVGALGQLDWLCEDQAFAPAKALTRLPRIRVMRGNNGNNLDPLRLCAPRSHLRQRLRVRVAAARPGGAEHPVPVPAPGTAPAFWPTRIAGRRPERPTGAALFDRWRGQKSALQ